MTAPEPSTLEAVIREQLTRVVDNALKAGLPSRGMFTRAVEEITRAAGRKPAVPPQTVHQLTATIETVCGADGEADGYSTVTAEVTCGACLGGA